jgi:DNA-binding response OmpR family regulator
MPIMDGWQATEKIRQRRGLNVSVPIVAVTANAMKGDRDKCIQAGMDDYISKPVDRKKLYEIIAKWTMVEAPAGAPDKPSPSTAMSNSELIGETSEGRSDVSSSG